MITGELMMSHLLINDYIWLIAVQIGKLHIYYGADDGWSPLQYRDNLLQAIPAFPADDAVVDDHDIPHAFVEFHSEIIANIVADWINTLDKEN